MKHTLPLRDCHDACLQGDQLIATSGYTYERETQYQSVQVRSGERVVRLTARGEVRLPDPHFCVLVLQHLNIQKSVLLLSGRMHWRLLCSPSCAAGVQVIQSEWQHVSDAL